ncbi:MAG: hypothetical protein ACR650_11155 [Methylocystis sp.]
MIRKARSPWRAYAALEAAIGFWAVVSVWLLPGAAGVIPFLLGAEPSPFAMWFASFALDRLTAAIEGAANSSAGVYGANTAGAVAGALVCARSAWPSLVRQPHAVLDTAAQRRRRACDTRGADDDRKRRR